MNKPSSNPVLGQLSELGKSIGQEAAKAPTDLIGSALETLGPSSPQSQKSSHAGQSGERPAGGGPQTPWHEIDRVDDRTRKKAIARAALAALAAPRRAEPSVYEQNMREEEQKREALKAQEAQTSSQLQPTASKRPRGDLYGAKKKQTKTEMGRDSKSG